MITHSKPNEKATPNQQFLGHPKGLYYLFFAEMWERFSFHGMRAMLIIYMTQELLYNDVKSFGVYAAYGSILYATPLIGGMLADKIIGYRNAIIIGGILMTIGHFTMAIETPIFFYGSLALIIIGNGFFKPNISSMVGTLYGINDSKRESGYTIFYLGINVGGAIAPLLCAWLGYEYGWHYGFGAAGIGMVFGLFTFILGVRSDIFGHRGLPPKSSLYPPQKASIIIFSLALVAVPLFALAIYFYQFEHYLVWLVTVIVVVILLQILRKVSTIEKQRLLVVSYFIILATVFWAIFEQAGSSLTLFAARNVNLEFLNASQTNSLNSGFIILLAIPFSMIWKYLSTRNKNFSSTIKFGIGLILLGLGYLVFAYSSTQADSFARVPMFFLILGTLIYTVGELFISPIGLSKASELSPVKYAAFIMGMWFLSSFYGHFFAGKLANLTAKTNVSSGIEIIDNLLYMITQLDPNTLDISQSNWVQLYQYVSTFGLFGIFSIALGLFALIIAPIIKKGMHGIL
jgi:POT family proton-dependent oligopeptide transporter